MMWLNKDNISWYAYVYCRNVKDDPKIRKHITDADYSYWYCLMVNDDPEVRKYITSGDWPYWYCIDIYDNDSGVKKYITDEQHYKDLERASKRFND